MNHRIIEDISNFIFVEDPICQADVIIVPGGSYPEPPEHAAKLWRQGYAQYILATGGVSVKTGKFNGVKSKSDIYNLDYQTEAAFYKDVLLKNRVLSHHILCEDRSGSTAENALFSKTLLDNEGFSVKKAIICCKNFHARRCLMFFQFAFPETEFIISSAPYHEQDIAINKKNWYKSEAGQKRVMGEMMRLSNQFTDDFKQFIMDDGPK